MITTNLNSLTLAEFQGKNHPELHCRATFPLVEALGTKNSTLVYFELKSGNSLGRHTDSEEEVLLILDGEVEVTVGEEQDRLAKNEIALVPKMAPHNVRNVGAGTAKVLGFFGSKNIVATFDAPWLPADSNIVDTAQVFAKEAE
jgi:quercetin dioxygenase-like cupin family protein